MRFDETYGGSSVCLLGPTAYAGLTSDLASDVELLGQYCSPDEQFKGTTHRREAILEGDLE